MLLLLTIYNVEFEVGYELLLLPAVNQYWVVSSFPLNFGHLLNDINEHLQVGAGAIRRPVGHMKLSHLVELVSLAIEYHNIKCC